MTDRYVIVCRDGLLLDADSKKAAELIVRYWHRVFEGHNRPAYRIRIREKAASPMDCAAP